MSKGLERVTLPTPQEGFDPQDEAQFRRALERFMATADGRVREVDEDLEDLDARVAALEGASDAQGLVLIEAQSPSGVATVDFTTGIDTTYDEYLLEILNAVPATDAVTAGLQTSTDNGATWDSGAADYDHAASEINTDPGVTDAGDPADSRIRLLGGSVGSDVNENGVSVSIRVARPAVAEYTQVFWHGVAADSLNKLRAVYGGGRRLSATAVNGLRFLFSSGNVESGEFKLYGLVKS